MLELPIGCPLNTNIWSFSRKWTGHLEVLRKYNKADSRWPAAPVCEAGEDDGKERVHALKHAHKKLFEAAETLGNKGFCDMCAVTGRNKLHPFWCNWGKRDWRSTAG
eukprot:777385-Prymnesium_polylepis.2